MEVTPWMVYWISRLDGISVLATVFAALTGIATFVFLSIRIASKFCDYNDSDTPTRVSGYMLKRIAPIFVILFSIALFVPTTKEMCAIVVIPKIVNSEKLQNIGNEFYELALDWLKDIKESKTNHNQ